MTDDMSPIVDSVHPHTARIWNYFLGGKDNYESDREAGKAILKMMPELVDLAREDREFLRRSVAYLAGKAGVRQFLDIGIGLPTANNTHEVAQSVTPESRIGYADNDPLILAHARALLTSSQEGATDYIDAGLHQPEVILREARQTLDFGQPVALILCEILLHVLDDDEAYKIVRTLLDALPSGSDLVLTHPTDDIDTDLVRRIVQFWNEGGGVPPMVVRTRSGIVRFFDGLELLEPGVVSTPMWRPEPSRVGDLRETVELCGVARKP